MRFLILLIAFNAQAVHLLDLLPKKDFIIMPLLVYRQNSIYRGALYWPGGFIVGGLYAL